MAAMGGTSACEAQACCRKPLPLQSAGPSLLCMLTYSPLPAQAWPIRHLRQLAAGQELARRCPERACLSSRPRTPCTTGGRMAACVPTASRRKASGSLARKAECACLPALHAPGTTPSQLHWQPAAVHAGTRFAACRGLSTQLSSLWAWAARMISATCCCRRRCC